ncbi:hypothetical protein ON010_g2675 [Phytophthora cinnamomi]|nr:hypothetical protein ON010_g2675 [Phytophthora cinnamomi]
MATDAPPSPVKAKLTQAMKDYIESKLKDTPSMKAQLAYSFLCREIRNRHILGVVPALEKVQNFVKSWRQKNKPDSMAPVLEIFRESMDDVIDADRGRDALVILCGSKVENGVADPVLGTGSVARLFRISLTSMQLVERYVDIQRDPDLRTMLHLDSTHSIVKQGYPVFVLGISDLSGGFHPVVYCCTFQRRGVDISWCLAFLKRVVLQEFHVGFSPDFVMMDVDTADKAQYKACAGDLPDSVILMCWFHVT